MPALLLQSEAGGMLANGFTVLCLLSPGGGVERSSGSLPGRPNVVSGVAGTCPRATPVSRRSAVGMAHKRSIRLQCMMSFPTVSLLLFQPICSDSIRAPWHFVDAHAYAITAVSARVFARCRLPIGVAAGWSRLDRGWCRLDSWCDPAPYKNPS